MPIARFQMPDGRIGRFEVPEGLNPEQATSLIDQELFGAQEQKKPTERTFGEALTDIGAGLKSGAGSLLQLPSQISGVVTGNYDKPGKETGLAAAGKELQTEAEAMKSPGLKAREEQRAQKIAEAEKQGQMSAFFTAFSETAKDPGLLLNFLAEQAPQLIPSLGAAKLIKPIAGTAAAVRGAVGTGAVQQGADIAAGTYEDVYKALVSKGVPETQAAGEALGYARATGASAAVISLLAQRLPGARTIEEAFAGQEGKLGRILGGVRGAAGEALSETAEETGGKLAQNIALQQVSPETELTSGLGQVAGMAALGGVGLGGVSGLAQRQAAKEKPKPEETNIPSQFSSQLETPAEIPPIRHSATEFEQPPPKVTEEQIPKIIEEKVPFEPVTLPDNTVALTKEDLVDYEKEKTVKAPEETTVPVEELRALPSEEIDALRARAEAPPIEEGEYVSDQPVEREEISGMRTDAKQLEIEKNKLKRGEPGKSLWSAIQGNLTPSDLAELGGGKFKKLNAPEGEGKSISELAADGALNDWLPGELRINRDEMDISPEDALDRAIKADQYIKDRLIEGNYLTYETNLRLEEIGTSLREIERSYQEINDEEYANGLAQEAVNEQRRIDQEAATAPAEGEVGGIEPPERIFERPPEEQIKDEDEYYPDKYLSIEPQRDVQKNPSFRREAAKLIKTYNTNDKMTAEYAMSAIGRIYDRTKIEENIKPRRRGATWIRRKLLEAVDEGVLDEKALDFAEWLIKQNPALVEDLAIAVQTAKEGNEAAGGYNSFGRMFALFKGRASDKTAVHEILHHMERMMPENVQDEIRKLWIKNFIKANKEASKSTNENVKSFFNILNNYHFGGGAQSETQFRSALQMISDGKVPSQYYQYANASEFWAVNATDIMSRRFEAKQGVINRLRNWLSEFVQYIKDAFGFTSNAPIIKALDSLIKGDGKFKSQTMLGTATTYESIAGKAKDIAQKVAKKASGQRQIEEEGFEGIDPKLMGLVKKHFFAERKTIVDKIDGLRDNFWKKMAQGVADQYRSIKDYTDEGYMLARLSKSVDGALEGMLFNGHIKLTDGALDIKQNTKGLMQVMEPIGKEVDRYMIWVALNRDADLREKGRMGSISPELVAKRKQFAAGTLNGKSRLETYQEVQKNMNALNRSVLDIAYKQGIIDRNAYNIYASDINYIPFYKEMESGDIQGASTASGLASQYFSKQLEGGEKAFGDLMENTLRNWSHILSAAMKNKAANTTIDAALKPEYSAAFPILKSGLAWEDGKVIAVKRLEKIARIENNDDLTDAQKNSKINEIMKPYIDAVMERNISSQEKQNLIKGLYEGLADGDGKLRPEYTTSKPGAVKTMREGKPIYFDVSKNPLLFESIMSIGYLGPKSKFLDVAKDFKNILQYGVTLSPAFKVRNLIRDSVQAAAISPLGLNIGANVVQGINLTKKDNPDYISALAGGGIFNFGSAVEGDQAKLVRRLIKNGVDPKNIWNSESKISAGMASAWKAYQDWGNKSEAANRMALYKQLRDKGLSHLEASFQARDLLDFSMQGSWPALRLVTQVVPFLNARIQGLYKLGRDGIIPTSRVIYNRVTGRPIEATDKQKAQQFSVVTGAVVLASMMLYLAFKDDDEFKKREQWDRDNFWWFRLPGMEAAVRIPKPFEIGAFGTLAERLTEQIADKGAEGRVFEQSLKRMLTDTFAINPMPQMFKPLVDLYANKDSFTGAPIETAGMERLSKAERIASGTSPLAIALSKVTNVFLPESMEASPVQTDYAIKAYLGWLGATISATSHYAVQPFSKSAYPDHNWTDTISMGFVKTLPATQSGYVTSFYENMKIIEQSYADMRHYAQIGESSKVQQIIEEQGDKIAMAKFYDQTSKDMSKIRQVINVVQNDQTMSGSAKREEIDRLKILIGELAKQAEEVRKSMRK